MKHERITPPEDDYSLGNASPLEIQIAFQRAVSRHHDALVAQGLLDPKHHFPACASSVLDEAITEANHAHRRREWELRNAN